MRIGFLTLLLAVTSLTGCHVVRETCNEPQPYERARVAPPLKVPADVTAVNTKGALAIPDVPGERKTLTPKDACRDAPPAFYSDKGTPSGG